MTITVIDHGTWERYEPDDRPVGAPESALFARRLSDGLDWYQFARDPESWTSGSLRATCIATPNGQMAAAIVTEAATSTLFPSQGGQIIEILGHDPEDTKPHKTYEGRLVNLDTGDFRLPPKPPVDRVSSAQAQTALYKRGFLPRVRAIVEGHPYEPVRIFFNSAGFWDKANPYVQAIATELGLTDAQLDSLFDLASTL